MNYSLNSLRSIILNNKIENIDVLERSGVNLEVVKKSLKEHLYFKRFSRVAGHMFD
jgi:hypothetical protein